MIKKENDYITYPGIRVSEYTIKCAAIPKWIIKILETTFNKRINGKGKR